MIYDSRLKFQLLDKWYMNRIWIKSNKKKREKTMKYDIYKAENKMLDFKRLIK